MKVIRYSKSGFKPQKQTHHLNDYVYYHLYRFNISDFPEFMKYDLLKIHKERVKFYREHLLDLKEGIWIFIDGYKDNQSLNHLKEKVPCWSADVMDDIDVYGVNWDKTMKLSDPEVKLFGCYVPKRELDKFTNIQRRVPLK